MFDCYHVQIMEGDLCRRLEGLLDVIGHIQFAAVPGRGEPGVGEIDYRFVFDHIAGLGYAAPLGAEYTPTGLPDDSLGWLKAWSDGSA